MKIQVSKKHLQNHITSENALFLKRNIVSYPRYLFQMRKAKKGFQRFGNLYDNNILFIAGLPKSGTSWLKKMLTCYPGYQEVMLPEANVYEIDNAESHSFELPSDTFSRFKKRLVVLKLHSCGSKHNLDVLTASNIQFVVIYRDLRDVAVSYCFYVRQTPWHPEYKLYNKLSIQEGLRLFADNMLCDYLDWIESWEKTSDSPLSLVLSYENLLSSPHEQLSKIANHFGLDSSLSKIEEIVSANSFLTLSSGREQGQENNSSFFRKGVAGDWVNHFTPELKELYKKLIGHFLVTHHYEENFSW
jgi:hypothetical protein